MLSPAELKMEQVQWKDGAGRHSYSGRGARGKLEAGPAPQREVAVREINLGVTHTEMNIPPRLVDMLPKSCV